MRRAAIHRRRGKAAWLVALAMALAAPGARAGLVGYWSFDEGTGLTAHDGSGYLNHGTLANMSDGEWEPGHTGAPGDFCLHFDGGDDVVRVPDSPSLSLTGDLTIAAWLHGDGPSFSGNRNIVAKDSNDAYRFRVDASGGQLWLLLNDGTGHQLHPSGVTPPSGSWHHVATTVDFADQKVRFYLDGNLARQMDTTKSSIADTGGGLTIGSYSWGGSEVFDGLLDDVAVYDQRLSNDQVRALATGTAPPEVFGPPPPPKGTVRFVPITSEVDSEIDLSRRYTHTLDGGTRAAAVVNDVRFTQLRTGSLPLSNFDWTVTSGSRQEHGGDDGHNVSGEVVDLFRDMLYNGHNSPGGQATITLSGLLPGGRYDARLFARQWDPGSVREAIIGFDVDGDGTFDNQVTVDQNHATSVGFSDDRQAYALSYEFVAESEQATITFGQTYGNQSWHLYGFTNELVEPPPNPPGEVLVRGVLTCDNAYQFFLSTDDSVLGTPIGANHGGSMDWATPEGWDFFVPVEQPLYLHVVGTNAGPGHAGLMANFELPEWYAFEATGERKLLTEQLLWRANYTGFADPMTYALSQGGWDADPWASAAGLMQVFDPASHWLWLGEAGQSPDGSIYLSVPFTVRIVPEPSSLLLLGLGAAAAARRRRRSR
ncbi:MAG: LamG domain-containing protein [Candidatus Brocadiia bacterium]